MGLFEWVECDEHCGINPQSHTRLVYITANRLDAHCTTYHTSRRMLRTMNTLRCVRAYHWSSNTYRILLALLISLLPYVKTFSCSLTEGLIALFCLSTMKMCDYPAAPQSRPVDFVLSGKPQPRMLHSVTCWTPKVSHVVTLGVPRPAGANVPWPDS